MNAAQRLSTLSGLAGVSAAVHLKAIAGAAGVAGVLLVAYSQLPTGTAAQHLFAERSQVEVATPGYTAALVDSRYHARADQPRRVKQVAAVLRASEDRTDKASTTGNAYRAASQGASRASGDEETRTADLDGRRTAKTTTITRTVRSETT